MDVHFKLESSSKRVGRLYPVLEDHYGNIIDGQHRLATDSEWPRVRLEHIVSEKERVMARLISNVCRRTVSRKEKTEILGTLSEIMLREGVQKGDIGRKIAEESGMSYRWVAKYLPQEYKDDLQSARASSGRHPARLAWIVRLLKPPTMNLVSVSKYANTNCAIYTVKRSLHEKVERAAKTFGTTPKILIQNILEEKLREIRSLKRKEIEAVESTIAAL